MNRVALLCATQVATAFAARNGASLTDTTDLIASLTGTFSNLGKEPVVEVAAPVPAVSIRKSVTQDYLICLEDGRQMKSLKRHLRTRYGMTPEDYRAKWGLAADYPMVAPGYAARRSEIAKSFGLGVRKPAVKTEAEIAATFKPEGIVCLIDQKVVKDLGRHARKHHGVNATAYREQFGLPADYPMTLEGVAAYMSARASAEPVALAA